MTYAINYIDRRIYFKLYKSKVQHYWNLELKKMYTQDRQNHGFGSPR